jgi:hypothetical protein
MKKSLCFLIILLVVTGSFNVAALFQKEKKEIQSMNEGIKDSWKFTLSSSYPEIIDQGQYVKINIKETNEFLNNPGYPMLPFYSITKTLPFGTKIIDVKCTPSEPEKIYLSKEVYPAPQIEWQSNNSSLPRSNYMESSQNEYYSYKTGGGIEDGKHVTFFTLHFNPVQKLPVELALNFVKDAEIEVIYEKPLKPIIFEDIYKLVIIAPSSFSTRLPPLVTHKNKFGLSAKIVTLDEIYNGVHFPVEGRDNPEKIKYFIKNALEQWGTLYVLLVGDIYRLPIRKTYVGNFDLPTDLYYADIYFSDGSFSSWDTNGNGRYGEYWQSNDDIVDLYADVYIGRVACKSSSEVRNIVNKIIRYEESTYGKDWFKKILLCGGDTHPFGSVYEGEVTLDEIEKVMPEFEPIKLYASKGDLSDTAINRELNKGAGFMAYSGHGFEVSIATHPPKSEEWIAYNRFSLFGLFNFNKLPIVFFDACLTAGLDYTLGDYLEMPSIKIPLNCIAWCFVNKIIGGAIATIGATRVAFSMVDENGPHAGSSYLGLHFFKNYEEDCSVAEMFFDSQKYYLDTVWEDPLTIEEFLLLGDPSLRVGGYN